MKRHVLISLSEHCDAVLPQIKCQVSGLAANPAQHLHYSCAGFRAIVVAHS